MKTCVVLCLLLLSFTGFAQDDEWKDTTIVTKENILEEVTVEPAEEERATVSFNEVGQPAPVELKKLPAGTVDRLKKDEDYWYADWEPQKPKPQEKEPPSPKEPVSIGWLRPLFWIIIIAVLMGGIVWFLANNDVRLFAKPSKKIDTEQEEEEISDDIFAINYEKEIGRAEQAGNYRLAVRLWYLRTLRELADRGLIDYRYGKTNSDYVFALYGGKYYKTFFGLTRMFDYTWYGQFPLSAEKYTQVAGDFVSFKNGLGA